MDFNTRIVYACQEYVTLLAVLLENFRDKHRYSLSIHRYLLRNISWIAHWRIRSSFPFLIPYSLSSLLPSLPLYSLSYLLTLFLFYLLTPFLSYLFTLLLSSFLISLLSSFFTSTHWDCCLDVAEWLVRPNDSKSYAGGGVYTPGRASQAGKVKE